MKVGRDGKRIKGDRGGLYVVECRVGEVLGIAVWMRNHGCLEAGL